MRVAVVTTSFPAQPGDPAGHFVAHEVQALLAAGHQVTLIGPAPCCAPSSPALRVIPLPHGDAFGWPGALSRLRERPQRARGALRFVWHARHALERAGPFDRVIAHWLVPCAWPIASGITAPLEVVAHGSDVRLLLGLPRALAQPIVRTLVRRDARLRFVSTALRDELVTAFPEVRQLESVVQPCAVDVSAAPSRAEARAQCGIAPELRLVLIASRLVASKRVDVALGAACLLPDARVMVLGDGPERPRLTARFPDASFLGQVPRPLALTYMAASDVLLSASRVEGAPLALREARALGVPVVTAPFGDAADWARSDPELFVIRPL